MPGPPAPHRRRRRAGRRRGPRPARHHACAPAVTGGPVGGRPVGTTRPRRRFVRPVRPVVPLVSCAGVLLAWGLVAHNSGAGWVQAVGDVLAGILVVGLVAPAVVAARGQGGGRRRSPATPPPACPSSCVARATTRLRVKPLDPPGPESFVGPHRARHAGRRRRRRAEAARPRARRPVTLVPPSRGVYDRRRASRSPARRPSACCGGARPSSSALPRPLHVGPRLGRPLPLPRGPGGTTGGGGASTRRSRSASPAACAPTGPGTTGAGCTGPPPPTAAS